MGSCQQTKRKILAVLYPLPLPQKSNPFYVAHPHKEGMNMKQNTKKLFNVQTMVVLGVLVAMEIILSRFLSIAAWNMKIGFSFVPIAIAALSYGPIAAGIVAALGDFVGALLFPIGAYFPGFTLSAFLTGILFGVFLYKKQTVLRVAGAVIVNQMILSLLINSIWISILYGTPVIPLMGTRIIQCLIMIPIQFVIISSVAKVNKDYIVRKVDV